MTRLPRSPRERRHWTQIWVGRASTVPRDLTPVRFDPNQVEGDWSIAFTAEGRSFEAWLEGWLRGEELFEAGMGSPG